MTDKEKKSSCLLPINNSVCVLFPVVCSCKLHASAVLRNGKQSESDTLTPTHTNRRISDHLCRLTHRGVIYVKMGFLL